MEDFRWAERRMLLAAVMALAVLLLSVVSWFVPTWSVAITVIMLAGALWAIVLVRSADDHAG